MMKEKGFKGCFWKEVCRLGVNPTCNEGTAGNVGLTPDLQTFHPCCDINKVILNLIQDLQRLLLPWRNSLRGRSRNKFGNYALFNERNDERGRSRIQYGMTPHFTMTRGFTLLELLVVILIIGILAAVALPQYQLAVLKARGTELLTGIDAVVKAQQIYFLEHGTYQGGTENTLNLDITWDHAITCELREQDFVLCQTNLGNGRKIEVHIYPDRVVDKRCLVLTGDVLGNKWCQSYGTWYADSHGYSYYKIP